MQTTLDNICTSSESVENTTLNYTDEYLEYLYSFSEDAIDEYRIKEHLKEEKAEMDDIKRRYEEFRRFESEGSSKPQYIRVGKHNDA